MFTTIHIFYIASKNHKCHTYRYKLIYYISKNVFVYITYKLQMCLFILLTSKNVQ